MIRRMDCVLVWGHDWEVLATSEPGLPVVLECAHCGSISVV